MKLISILLGIITLPYADASNTPFVVEEVRQNEGTGNRCKVQVSLCKIFSTLLYKIGSVLTLVASKGFHQLCLHGQQRY
jgi:hypothetical protein